MSFTVEQAESRVILKMLAGSHVHGLAVETSDKDYESIIIEPLAAMVTLGKPWEDIEQIGQTAPDGSKLPDVKYYSLRKWCSMASRGNPNFILPLFAPLESILKIDAIGSQLREMKEAFISKQAIRAHLGYMQGQRSRMVNHQATFGGGHGRGLPRFDLIEKYGYDTKFAMHLLRLGYQGLELATDGRVTLPIWPSVREQLLSVRRGELTLTQVLEWADDMEGRMKIAFDASSLPDNPDMPRIEAFMQKTYIRTWSADRTIQDHLEDRKRTIQ